VRFARPSAWGTLKQRCASSVTDGVAPDPGGPTSTGSWRWPRTTAATSNRKTSSFSRRRSGTISEGHLHSSLSRCRAQRTHPASLAMRCDLGLPPGHARRVWPPTCCWYSPSSSPTLSPTRLQLLRSGPRSITTEFASRCAIARSGHHASAPALMLPAASGSSSSPPSPTNGAGRPQLPARLCGPNITTSKENQRGAVAIEAAMVPQPTRVSNGLGAAKRRVDESPRQGEEALIELGVSGPASWPSIERASGRSGCTLARCNVRCGSCQGVRVAPATFMPWRRLPERCGIGGCIATEHTQDPLSRTTSAGAVYPVVHPSRGIRGSVGNSTRPTP
jgi:hypothetical protein